MIPGIVAQGGLGAAPVGQRWWRIRFPNLNSGNNSASGGNHYIDLRYISMATAPGGTNLVPSNLGYDCVPNAALGAVPNTYVDSSSTWSNWGIQTLGDDTWLAFLLDTPLDIKEVKIRNHSTSANYSPRAFLLESSVNGLDWTFHFGQTALSWGSAELKTFVDPEIDWETATYRDWRMDCVQSSNYNNLGIYEMEMASSPGGANMCTGGTPRSTNNASYPASNLTDGNINTLCGSIGAAKYAYVGYSFATAVKVEEIRMAQLGAESMVWGLLCVGTGSPGSFQAPWWIKREFWGVGRSDPDKQWVTFDGRRSLPSNADDPHRYWRIRPAKENFADNATLAYSEVDFRVGGSSLVGSGTPDARKWFDATTVPANAFDGNPATVYSSPNTNLCQWLSYDFGTPVQPDEVRLTSRNDSYWSQASRRFSLEWSDDGRMWYTKKTFNSGFTGQGQTETYLV